MQGTGIIGNKDIIELCFSILATYYLGNSGSWRLPILKLPKLKNTKLENSQGSYRCSIRKINGNK